MDTKSLDRTAATLPAKVLDIHHISKAQLAALGLEQIAFIKPVTTEEGAGYAIHAADGTPMALAPDVALAAAAIIQHEMTPVLVH
jgi:hypothetical protein